ncbi:MAG: endolytic transglycosylase MltG [Propionibacteriaceae bacterium]|jgi:UPF0755 protein|nr:endolytic transglycosylase MltG [Propionibacteriaceae bacterium]
MTDRGNGWIASERSRRAKSAVAVALSFIILLGGVGFGLWKGYAAYMDWRQDEDYIGDGADPVEVYIPPTAGTVGRIADILVANEVIRDPRVFENAAIEKGVDTSMPSGTFNLLTHLPAATALDMLFDAKNRVQLKLTIQEGWRLSQIKAEMIKVLQITEEDVDQALAQIAADPGSHHLNTAWVTDPAYPEGYLFPDTYFVEPHNALAALDMMTAQFATVTGPEGLNLDAAAANLSTNLGLTITPAQVVIVASIIEGEVNQDQYRPMVARAIYNRLAINMPLGIESAFRYGRERANGTPYDDGVSTAEQNDASLPYNFYIRTGLPDTPISNPSRSAMEAALNPTPGDWIYWLTTNPTTGETGFASDDAGYIALRDTFIQWCSDNGNPASLC